MLSRAQKDFIISKLQSYYYEERQEDLGLIGAENLYAFIIDHIAPLVYNQALNDVRQMLEQQWASLDEELYVLEKPIDKRR
ncbi:MAG: DUF2164 domain-containing protein [Tuberibacillus sp.]